MKILVLGATGFIGNAVFLSLLQEHDVSIAGRKPIDGFDKWKYVDFLEDNNWTDLINGIDLVINCIGIMEGDFEKVQVNSPIKLYEECVKQQVKIIHISAIGAEEKQPVSDFLRTKKKTDDFLLSYNKAKIIYPGIVLGRNGKSTRFFTELAHLPVIPMIKMNDLPFVHINQLVYSIKRLITDFDNYPNKLFVFAETEPLQNILEAIRGKKIKTILFSKKILKILFTIFPKFSIGIFNKTTFDLSEQDLTKKHRPMFKKISTQIKNVNFKKGNAIFNFMIVLTIGFVWIWSGISSMVSWDISMDLMQSITNNKLLSEWAIYLASILDIVLGIAVFSKKYRSITIKIQLTVMAIYMLILSIYAPEFWIHPFGVLIKNIPLIMLSLFIIKREN